MIRYCEDKNEIIPLWQEAFGDTEKEIKFFTDNVKNASCLVYCKGDKIASMMFLVDCFIDGKKGKYAYACCTLKEYRGLGLMSELLSFAQNEKYNFLCLIPASDSLIDFYEKRGFTKREKIGKISFEQIPEIKEYLFEGFELTNPVILINSGD